jgi:hypothetical protein
MKGEVAGGWMKLYNEDKNKEYELSWSCSTNGRIMYVYIHT